MGDEMGLIHWHSALLIILSIIFFIILWGPKKINFPVEMITKKKWSANRQNFFVKKMTQQ